MKPETALVFLGPKRFPRKAKKERTKSYRKLILGIAEARYVADCEKAGVEIPKVYRLPRKFYRDGRRYLRSLRVGFIPRGAR